MLSFPKRLRYFLSRDADLPNRVLRIFLNSVEEALQSCCADAPEDARLGAVSFVHRFGSALNGKIHFHCCVIDGLFSAEDEGLRFDEVAITREAIAKVQTEVRERILRLFKRRSLLSPEDVEAMRLSACKRTGRPVGSSRLLFMMHKDVRHEFDQTVSW